MNVDLDSFVDPFRREVCLVFWTKLQKVPTVCNMVSRESLLRRQTQNPGKVLEAM